METKNNSNTSANKRMAKNSLFLSIRMIFVLVIGLYTSRVILQVLGVTDYGVYNVVCGFVSMFAFLASTMSTGIQRFYNYKLGKGNLDNVNKVYNTALFIQILLSIIIIIVSETFGLWYLCNKMVIPADRMNAAHWIYQLSILSFVLVIMQVPYKASILAHECMNFFAFLSIFEVVLKLLIVYIIPVLKGDDLIIYGILLLIVNVLHNLISYLYTKKRFAEIYISKLYIREYFTQMLSFSGWNVLGSFAIMMREQGVNLVLNLFFGPVVNAARAIAVQVNSGLLHVVRNITMPVKPQVIQSYASGNVQRALNLTYTISKLSFVFLYATSLPVLLELDYVLKVWLGDNIPEYTNIFVVLIVCMTFFHNFFMIISDVVQAEGDIKRFQVITSLAIISSVPLSYLVLKTGLDAEWAMWMTLLSMLLAFIFALLELRRVVDFKILMYCKNVLLPIVLVLILTLWIPFIPHYLIHSGFVRLVVVTSISIISIMAALYMVGLNTSEKALVISIINKIIKKR